MAARGPRAPTASSTRHPGGCEDPRCSAALRCRRVGFCGNLLPSHFLGAQMGHLVLSCPAPCRAGPSLAGSPLAPSLCCSLPVPPTQVGRAPVVHSPRLGAGLVPPGATRSHLSLSASHAWEVPTLCALVQRRGPGCPRGGGARAQIPFSRQFPNGLGGHCSGVRQSRGLRPRRWRAYLGPRR